MDDMQATMPGYEEFHIKYDGAGIRDGQINAKDLAESLLALTTLIERSNQLLNGKDSEIAVKVKSNMQPGSFVVHIVNFITKVAEIGASQPAGGWANVATLIGFTADTIKGGKSLFRLLKEAHGRRITSKLPQSDGSVTVILDDNDNSKVEGLSRKVLDLYDDMVVRHSVDSMSQILNSDSIASMEFFGGGGNALGVPAESLTKDDLPALRAPESDVLLETEVEKILIISTANIEGGTNGWRFKEDAESSDFAADILDESFLEQIRTREITLGRGDMLKVKLFTQQKRPRRNLKTTYMILSVLAYISYEEPEE
jgi:hypothetical protein